MREDDVVEIYASLLSSIIKKISYKRRMDIRNHINFKRSNLIWNRRHFNASNNIGHLTYLAKKYKVHLLKPSETTSKYFSDCYFNKGVKNSRVHGRTTHQFTKNAFNFHKACLDSGINISKYDAIIYCYIRVFDETVLDIQRELKALEIIKKEHPDMTVEFADNINDVECGLDIVIKNNKGVIVKGYQVKSYKYKNSKTTHILDANTQNKKRFKCCLHKWGFEPEYIWVD